MVTSKIREATDQLRSHKIPHSEHYGGDPSEPRSASVALKEGKISIRSMSD